MARVRDVVFDCRHAASQARFWAAVLDDYDVAPYDDAEAARLACQGITDLEDDPTVLLQCSGPGPRLWFQAVPEPKTTKNRVHLDLSCDAFDAEQPNDALVVLCDPEGNEFCLVHRRAGEELPGVGGSGA